MTAESFAELVNARRAGAGRWQALCPAHEDSSPSLSITQGHSGILLHCWSHGCKPELIVAAMGLSMRDLFTDADTTPQQRREAAQRSRERDAEAKAAHHAGCQRNRELLRLECLRDSLGNLLMRRPDDVEVSHLFNGVLDKLRNLEAASNAPEDGPMRCQPTPKTPLWIADALHQIGASFDAKEKAASQAA